MVFNFDSLVRLAGDLPMQIKELYSCALTENLGFLRKTQVLYEEFMF